MQFCPEQEFTKIRNKYLPEFRPKLVLNYGHKLRWEERASGDG